MKHFAPLSACLLSMLSVGGAFAQATPSPVAHVYLTAPKSVYGYAAFAAGVLTKINGSPFTQTSGVVAGSNQNYFITVDNNYLHAYAVAASGAIGAQVSEANTRLYSSSQCGTANGAVLEQTGQEVYVLLNVSNNPTPCAVFQTLPLLGVRPMCL